MPKANLNDLRDLAVRAFIRADTSEQNAASVADALIAAEADGIRSHGLSRLPSYADQAISGKVDGHASPTIERPAAAVVRVDACSGFAYPAIGAGLDAAAETVRDVGVVAVGIGRSHHSGVAGHHVERMAKLGLIAIGLNNSPAGIAPWGGNRALYGTNPIAFACPRRDALPIVVDLSLSKVARGKVKLAADKGEPIPDGWAVDADGRPTNDAAAAMAGSMVPMGDAKGAALVLMVEILAATLTGSQYGYEASSFFTAEGEPPHVGQFFIVLDPDRLAGEGFLDRLSQLTNAILEQPDTRLPGDRRYAIREQFWRDGVEVPEDLYLDLKRRAGAE